MAKSMSLRAIEEKMARDLNEGPRRGGKKRSAKKSGSAGKRRKGRSAKKSGSASKRRSSPKRSASKRSTPKRDHVARRPKRSSGNVRRGSGGRFARGSRRDDDLNYTGILDDERINVNQDHEVDYWTRALGVSEGRLRSLVARHGVMVADVRRALRQGRTPTKSGRDRGAKRSGSKRSGSKRSGGSSSRSRPTSSRGRKSSSSRGRDRGSMSYAAAMRDLGYFG